MTTDQQPMPATRQAEIRRDTSETQITIRLDLDGTGRAEIETSVPFLNHMLTSFARHGRLDLTVQATGDTPIDDHHTVEDVGIVLGQALAQAVGTKAGIARFGYAYVPMDEALARAVLDISGRPFLNYEAPGISATLGGERVFHTDLVEEFWRAVVTNAGITLHLDLIRSHNAHHAIEAMFKAFALAWHIATRINNVPGVVPSTKGAL